MKILFKCSACFTCRIENKEDWDVLDDILLLCCIDCRLLVDVSGENESLDEGAAEFKMIWSVVESFDEASINNSSDKLFKVEQLWCCCVWSLYLNAWVQEFWVHVDHKNDIKL